MKFESNQLFLSRKINNMEQQGLSFDQEEISKNRGKDLAYSWVSTSRFLFYCQIAIYAALILGGCYTMYKHKYQGKPNVEIPANTQYNPQYK